MDHMLLASRVHQHPSPGIISQSKGLSKRQSFCDAKLITRIIVNSNLYNMVGAAIIYDKKNRFF